MSEDAAFLDVRVRLSSINFTQTDDDTLGVEIVVSASTSDGTATGKKVWLHSDQITSMVHDPVQPIYLFFHYYTVVILYCIELTRIICTYKG